MLRLSKSVYDLAQKVYIESGGSARVFAVNGYAKWLKRLPGSERPVLAILSSEGDQIGRFFAIKGLTHNADGSYNVGDADVFVLHDSLADWIVAGANRYVLDIISGLTVAVADATSESYYVEVDGLVCAAAGGYVESNKPPEFHRAKVNAALDKQYTTPGVRAVKVKDKDGSIVDTWTHTVKAAEKPVPVKPVLIEYQAISSASIKFAAPHNATIKELEVAAALAYAKDERSVPSEVLLRTEGSPGTLTTLPKIARYYSNPNRESFAPHDFHAPVGLIESELVRYALKARKKAGKSLPVAGKTIWIQEYGQTGREYSTNSSDFVNLD